MYQILCVLVATIAYGTAIGHCQGSQAGIAAITFQSSTYSDMRQLLAREAATEAVTVKANLGFPEQARDRYPAVIIVHTIAGYRDANEGYAAAELRKAGFATWSERPLRVNLRRTQPEQKSSGLPPKADIALFGRHVLKVPKNEPALREGPGGAVGRLRLPQ
jgi:hypothetical protein